MNERSKSVQFMIVLLIPVVFTFAFILTSAFPQQVEKGEGKFIVQKKLAPKINKPQDIRPGNVYPGDAAIAGYEETSVFLGSKVRSYQVKDKSNRTYIFSEVAGHRPGDNYGYFRVLDYYGYGIEQEDKRAHLIFAARTPMPACKDPVKAECGKPLRDAGGYIALFMYDSKFAIYHPLVNYGSGGLSYLDAYVPEQEITDSDGDGHIEFKAFTKLFEKREKDKFPSLVSSNILAIYRYLYDENCGCSKFVILKGKSFEKIYLKYANEMKEKRSIFAWLAAIESTRNPEEIRKALDEFRKFPSIGDKEKQRTLEILINNGFNGLRINDKNL